MSKRIHTVEIEGFGPITFRSLTKKQFERVQRDKAGNDRLGPALLIRRALMEPSPELLATQFEAGKTSDSTIDSIAMAILDHSWPRVGV